MRTTAAIEVINSGTALEASFDVAGSVQAIFERLRGVLDRGPGAGRRADRLGRAR